jgi:hypothetical protein
VSADVALRAWEIETNSARKPSRSTCRTPTFVTQWTIYPEKTQAGFVARSPAGR